MAAVRNSLKNRFISVNNNFSSTLSSAIGIGSQDISLVDTPTKLGNFGYITVDNSLGG
ncbi:MAG: hypothetical protein M0P71_18280 [Melioribacteraceae bacterium]|nr:hypothetical protein [Melioribacteraceae bacterium]